jgi:hypothetical protein
MRQGLISHRLPGGLPSPKELVIIRIGVLRTSIIFMGCVLLGALGCSNASDPPAAAAEASGPGSASYGRVTVQVAHPLDTEDQAPRVFAQATFVRWRGVSDHVIATMLDEPGAGVDDLRPGECRLTKQADALDEAATARFISLLDAGDILINSASALSAQRFPDLLPAMSGFTYRAPLDLPVADRFVVQNGGGEEIRFFTAEALTPAEPHMLSIAGFDPAPGIALARRAPINVHTDVTDDGYVELRGGASDAAVSVRCRPDGAGQVQFPVSLLSELPKGEARLSAVRATTAPLRGAAGLRRADLAVEHRDELTITLR